MGMVRGATEVVSSSLFPCRACVPLPCPFCFLAVPVFPLPCLCTIAMRVFPCLFWPLALSLLAPRHVSSVPLPRLSCPIAMRVFSVSSPRLLSMSLLFHCHACVPSPCLFCSPCHASIAVPLVPCQACDLCLLAVSPCHVSFHVFSVPLPRLSCPLSRCHACVLCSPRLFCFLAVPLFPCHGRCHACVPSPCLCSPFPLPSLFCSPRHASVPLPRLCVSLPRLFCSLARLCPLASLSVLCSPCHASVPLAMSLPFPRHVPAPLTCLCSLVPSPRSCRPVPALLCALRRPLCSAPTPVTTLSRKELL